MSVVKLVPCKDKSQNEKRESIQDIITLPQQLHDDCYKNSSRNKPEDGIFRRSGNVVSFEKNEYEDPSKKT